MTDHYDFWRRAIAGEKVGDTLAVHESEANCGFYRARSGSGTPFRPVAIWMDGENMVATAGNPPEFADPIEIWSYACRNAVTEQQYRDYFTNGRWHDEDEAVTASLAHSLKNSSDDPAEILKDQIESALAGVKTHAEIKDDAQAALAQGVRSRLLELGGDADKLRVKEKAPHLEAGKAVDKKFQPLVQSAQTGADAIRAALKAHENRKLVAEQAEKRRVEEAARLAAAEAVKNAPKGAPAPAPQPALPPAPAPVAAATIKGGHGRAASVMMVKVAEITDQDALYKHFREDGEIIARLAKLADKNAKAGIETPGMTIKEERDVR